MSGTSYLVAAHYRNLRPHVLCLSTDITQSPMGLKPTEKDLMHYVFINRLGRWLPERRRQSVERVDERRRQDAIRTTSAQYRFLQDCLRRREDNLSRLSRLARRLRHIVFSLSVGSVLVYLVSPQAGIHASWFGLDAFVTVRQISTAVPILLAYLIAYLSKIVGEQIQERQECELLDRALRQFGPTNREVLEPFVRFCEDEPMPASPSRAHLYYKISEGIRNFFLGATVTLGFVASLWIALPQYWGIVKSGANPAGWLLILILCLAPVAALARGFLELARSGKRRVLKAYLAGGWPKPAMSNGSLEKKEPAG